MSGLYLHSNQDLYEYLVRLRSELSRAGEVDLASIVDRASRFAAGSQTEFLYEAQEALQRVVRNASGKLTSSQREMITSVIRQIEIAFLKIGGA